MNPMQVHNARPSGIAILLGLLTAMPVAAAPVVVEVGGTSDPASIQGFVDTFRADLGNPNNGNAPGPLASGRREINWDAPTPATTSPGRRLRWGAIPPLSAGSCRSP